MKTIERIKAHFARDWWDAKEISVCYSNRPALFEFFLILICWGWIYHYCIAVPLCKIKDHDWEDEGYASPDSGCIDMVCQRCGYGPGREYLY